MRKIWAVVKGVNTKGDGEQAVSGAIKPRYGDQDAP